MTKRVTRNDLQCHVSLRDVNATGIVVIQCYHMLAYHNVVIYDRAVIRSYEDIW